MWGKRLQAYNKDNISNLNTIANNITPYSLDELALIFANYSPRDMIRIGAKVLAEQQELNPLSNKIEEAAVYRGIEKFCTQRVGEIITKDRILRELRKVRQVDFTIPYLANQIFREDQSSTRSRMQVWRGQEAIIEVERIDDPNSKQLRPVKLFAIKDIRVAKEIYPELNIPKFLEQKYKRCPNCDATVLRDWGEQDSSGICHDCQFDLISADKDYIDTWRRNALANQRRKSYKEETIAVLNGVQLSFDLDSREKE